MKKVSKICKLIIASVLLCTFIISEQAWAREHCYLDETTGETICESYGTSEVVKEAGIQKPTPTEQTEKKDSTPDTGVSTNTPAPQAQVTGCSSDLGLFSGLITTGREIFKGLRDLIYVVAGFGIIGVAVGGFFGNLNWKWLGAIIIGLVVIATTGELINTITGCEGFTTDMITDTLK